MTHSESTDVCLLLYPFRKSARNEWIPHKSGVLPRQRRFSIRLLQNSVPAWSVHLSPWVMWHYYGMFSGRLALFFYGSSQQIFHQNTSLPSNVRVCVWLRETSYFLFHSKPHSSREIFNFPLTCKHAVLPKPLWSSKRALQCPEGRHGEVVTGWWLFYGNAVMEHSSLAYYRPVVENGGARWSPL